MKKLRLANQLLGILALCLLGALLGCTGGKEQPTTVAPAIAVPATAAPTKPVTSPTPVPIVLLKTNPEQVPVGGTFTITGQGLSANKAADIVWVTVDGSWDAVAKGGSIEFHNSLFPEKRVVIGTTNTDAQGGLTATLKVPEDYGEIHDIFIAMDGKDVAKGGIRVPRVATISPTSGPVGTPITISANGVGWKRFDNTMGVRWDNVYGGYVSSVTTRGTLRAVIRAAGPPGKHFIDLGDASPAVSYLNAQQTVRQYNLPQFRFEFTVTGDNGPPPSTLEWPDSSRVASKPTLPLSSGKIDSTNGAATASLSPSAGPILSKTTLQARALPAGADIQVIWLSVTGNRVIGWSGKEAPLKTAKAASDGTLTMPLDIPDGLGGWHTVVLASAGKVLAEVPYFVERSLIGVTPGKVKVGEKFTVELKGIGWTELDNGAAVVYDNKFVGYFCGFGTAGYVSFDLMATGGAGTHLIDIYPMIFNDGNATLPWDFQMPNLTFAQDHPSLAMGYRLPAYRLAIQATE